MKKILALVLAVMMGISCMAEGVYPVTVTDHAGRSVTIERAPERIISCYYITTSLIMALGQGDKLAGVENNPELRPIYALSAPEILDLPTVGTAKEIDLEACAALEPDLVILPLRLEDSADTLTQLGMDVLLVNPESNALVDEMIRMVAKAAGAAERGEMLAAYIQEETDRLAAMLKDSDRPEVYLAGNSNMLSTAGDGMYQSDMIRLGGGKNVAAEIDDSYWCAISYEQLLAWDPEYIIMASAAKYSIEDVLNDPNLQGCRAVRNNNVYRIPDHMEAWDSPVPGGFLGAVWLAGVLHPDVMSEGEYTETIDEYYGTFYGIE